MSDWSGDANPGHQRRVQLQRAIEDEFGEPLADVIRGMREQGNSWRTVAGALGVCPYTLQMWRHNLDLTLDQHDNVFDPSSRPECTPTDRKARTMGYENATDAVISMRLTEGLTVQQAAEKLGVHRATVLRYTPRRLRGAVYNRPARWWQVRRAQCEAMNRGNTTTDHIWRGDNARVFQKKHNLKIT